MGANREMNDLDDRLRALDPFAGMPYAHADGAAMVERVTSGDAPRRRRRLKVLLGPLAVASVAGVAAVGALLSAGSPALQLSGLSVAGSSGLLGTAGHVLASSTQPLNVFNGYGRPTLGTIPSAYMDTQSGRIDLLGANSATAATAYRPSPTYLYALGTPLSASAPSLDAYAAIPPADPEGVLTAGAAQLGLVGTATKHATAAWQLGSEANPKQVRIAVMATSSGAGLFAFRYLRGDLVAAPARCPSGARSGAVDTDRLAMSSTLTGLLRSLSVRYSLGPPAYTTIWSRTPRTACDGTVLVTASVVVGGVATDQSVQVALDPAGAVRYADVPVFSTGRPAAYPLVSPANAAASLVTGSFRASLPPAGAVAQGQADKTATQGGALIANLTVVELHPPTVGLAAFATTSGTTWLLPVYAFTGDGFAAHAARQTEWSGDVLAASAPLVRVRGQRNNQASVFDLREVPTSP